MSKASHKFDEVEDYTTNSKNVYKDENGVYFSGEVTSGQDWKEELCLLKRIGSHENIVRFFICCTFDDLSVRKLTELCDASLEVYIEAKKKNCELTPLTQYYSDKKIKSPKNPKEYFLPYNEDLPIELDLLHQTAKGLKYLHDNDIIHRNIQPSNVLLTRTSQNITVAKLGGFQYSCQLEEPVANIYMATECHEGKWTKESDIFSYGILTYYTLTEGSHPFKFSIRRKWCIDKVEEKIISNIKEKKVAKVKHMELLNADDENRETQKAMIEQMVDHNSKGRLTIDEVLYHPTFYTPQRKLEFLLKVRESVKIFWTKKDHSLKTEIDRVIKGYEKKFDANKIFKKHYYFIDPKLEVENGWQPLYDTSGNIKTHLNGLRNKVAHACDTQKEKGTPLQFQKDFEVTDDSFSHAKFVRIFVTAHFPKLLVDLYNCYHSYNKTKQPKERYAVSFYPNYSNDCSNPK